MDPIANMIVQLSNAGKAGRDLAVVPYSAVKENIANVLKSEGFVKSVEKKMANNRPVLEVGIILENRIPKIKGIKRLSKTSKRVYKKSSEIRPVKSGYGSLVISTPKGIMSGREAKKNKLGGEVLFSIW
ncbi:MAG: ribosomal protein small subunit ribosomal protein [Parcubacteria group bacterium]|nr:ribosomal protein small subunit ribosomal protein [Parcubacteria group bacterium]